MASIFDNVDSIISDLCRKSEQTSQCLNWGERNFTEPLGVYLSSIAESAALHERGQAILLKNVERLLTNRLLLQRSVETSPLLEKIESPVFIVGMPRTGSTLLHNLLACDSETRTLKYYEGLRPVPLDAETSKEARVKAAARQIKILNRTVPGFAAIHAVTADGPEECQTVLENSFVDSIFEVRANIPTYSRWLEKNENTVCYYEEFREILQILGTNGKDRWVCKSPRHMMCLESLVHVFPDAKIIWTHRNPLHVLPSISSFSEVIQRVGSDQVDPVALGQFWLNRLAKGIEKAKKFRATDDPARYIDVQYSELVADPKKTVKEIYAQFKISYPVDLTRAMTKWLAENPKNKHGKHAYTLEHYGLSAEQIHERLAFISDDERSIYLDDRG